MLRPIALPLSKLLKPFLNLCFRYSWIPLDWRTAQVTKLERLLLSELLDNMHALDSVQGGFRQRRGVLDQSFNLHTLIQQYRHQYSQPPTLAFLDIKAAYDSVNRDVIWNILRPQLPLRLYLLIKHMFDDIRLSVISNNYESSFIYPRKGVLQGSILSPMLYAVFINTLHNYIRTGCTQPLLIRSLPTGQPPHTEEGILSIQRRSRRDRRLDTNITIINSLLYADDVVLIGSANDVVTMLHHAEQHSIENEYNWHPSKSVVINPSSSFEFTLYGQPLATASSFKYLDPPRPTEIYKINKQYKQEQHNQRQDAPNLELIKQCRRAVNTPRTDPILFIPCTSKERHRLIKWRMGWLIPRSSTPVACPCDNTSIISKKHFFLSCPLLHSNLELLDLLLRTHVKNYIRPQLPATEIDYLLNQLPGNFSNFKEQHWCHTWPVLNQILFQLDTYSHPSAIFDPEPPHGQLVFVPCSNTESSQEQGFTASSILTRRAAKRIHTTSGTTKTPATKRVAATSSTAQPATPPRTSSPPKMDSNTTTDLEQQFKQMQV
ncbi:hypothetical protein, partial, partial [Parasitella parasitica]